MPSIFERTLIPMGEGGCVITLPVFWLRFYGLKAGDKVTLIANDEIVIKPKPPTPDKSGSE
jgi:hypothetical protein